MSTENKRLTILSEEEKYALYALPDFDESQVYRYLTFTKEELKLIFSRTSFSKKIYCALQIGYFKAKHTFFNFGWKEVPEEDINFIRENYFSNSQLKLKKITNYEYYSQINQISKHFDYKLWKNEYSEKLYEYILKTVKRDINISFILGEILSFLKTEKIVRPGYSKLQDLISMGRNEERKRLNGIIIENLDQNSQLLIEQILFNDKGLIDLNVLKRDAKDFRYHMMRLERKKLEIIKPLYLLSKNIIDKFEVSKQNILHYADIINYYKPSELRSLVIEKSYLYFICYVWQRYLLLSDNLINAFTSSFNKFEDEAKLAGTNNFTKQIKNQQGQLRTIGKLLNLYVDENLGNEITFGEIREKYAYSLMNKDAIKNAVMKMVKKPVTEASFKWKYIDLINNKFKKHLRSIFMTLDFSSSSKNNALITVIKIIKINILSNKKIYTKKNIDFFSSIIPKKLKKHLLFFESNGKISGIQENRFEFWIYKQITKRLESGEIYIDDSINHRYFERELLPLPQLDKILSYNLYCLNTPIKIQLNEMFVELKKEWELFNNSIKENKEKHFNFDFETKKIEFKKPRLQKELEKTQNKFYEKLPMVDNIDVLRYVNDKCEFLSAFTPLQSHYSKKNADNDALLAVIISQAMNHGKYKFSKISDIPYYTINNTYHQFIRKSTLKEANDIICNATAKLPTFNYYSFDMDYLYGSVDGQKFHSYTPTTKARYSKKYFGKGRGVVSYTMLVNHLALDNETIGAHEHESYYVFDIYYNNTTDIIPDKITGDMHSINKANFIILSWFNTDFNPRFTDLETQLKHLYCGDDISNYRDYFIKPVGQINQSIIIDEWNPKIMQIIITLANKETTQSKIIRKLCTYKQTKTMKAIRELDKIKRSIYTLKYLRSFQLQRNVHKSQNRIESYHQLRAALSNVNGKKHLTGRTDLEIDISSQCGRLISNAIVYYNTLLLSKLYEKYKKEGNQIAINKIVKISPIAWQHIHFLGHYSFCEKTDLIDLEKIIEELEI